MDFEYPKPIAAMVAGGLAESIGNATSSWKYQWGWFLFPGTRNLIHARYKSEEELHASVLT